MKYKKILLEVKEELYCAEHMRNQKNNIHDTQIQCRILWKLIEKLQIKLNHIKP